jgi:hypothetical protein
LCYEQLVYFRGGSETGSVVLGRKKRYFTTWSGAELVKQAKCGNRITTDDGRQYEVVYVKRSNKKMTDWEIIIEPAEDRMEVESSVYSKVIDEVISSAELHGDVTFTRSEASLKHALVSFRRRYPGDDWVSHQSSAGVNQMTSQRTAVTSIGFHNSSDQAQLDTMRHLIMACLDSIGISQFDIWSDIQSDRILFYDPKGRTSPIAWAIIDRLDELVKTAHERIEHFGYLTVNGRRIDRDELEAALQLLVRSSFRKAA